MFKFLKTIFVWAACVLLILFLIFLILLKYPTNILIEDDNEIFQTTELPNNLPKVDIQVFETGYSIAPEAFITRGGILWKRLKIPHVSVLIRHPRGSFLLDGGLGTHADQEFHQAILPVQLSMNYKVTTPLVQNKNFQELNVSPDFILITHIHWDHLSGALDFPGIPVKMLDTEKYFINHQNNPQYHGIFPHQIEKIADRIESIELQDKIYENFSKSLDLYGDGSIVLVALPGHTPGSLGVFVNQPSGKRFFFIGDASYRLDSEGWPTARSFLAELLSDNNKTQSRSTLAKLVRLITRSNEITLVPHHDPQALENAKHPEF